MYMNDLTYHLFSFDSFGYIKILRFILVLVMKQASSNTLQFRKFNFKISLHH